MPHPYPDADNAFPKGHQPYHGGGDTEGELLPPVEVDKPHVPLGQPPDDKRKVG
jgi:hypothetical protein